MQGAIYYLCCSVCCDSYGVAVIAAIVRELAIPYSATYVSQASRNSGPRQWVAWLNQQQVYEDEHDLDDHLTYVESLPRPVRELAIPYRECIPDLISLHILFMILCLP